MIEANSTVAASDNTEGIEIAFLGIPGLLAQQAAHGS